MKPDKTKKEKIIKKLNLFKKVLVKFPGKFDMKPDTVKKIKKIKVVSAGFLMNLYTHYRIKTRYHYEPKKRNCHAKN